MANVKEKIRFPSTEMDSKTHSHQPKAKAITSVKYLPHPFLNKLRFHLSLKSVIFLKRSRFHYDQ